MSRRLLSAVFVVALVVSDFQPAAGAVPLDVIAYSGQFAPMTDG